MKSGGAWRHAKHRFARTERTQAVPAGRGRAAELPFLISVHGAIAQLGEHLLCKQGVVGSIPTGSTSEARLKIGSLWNDCAHTFMHRSIVASVCSLKIRDVMSV